MIEKNKRKNSESKTLTKQSSNFTQSVFSVSMGTIVLIIFLFIEMMIAVRYIDEKKYGIYILLITVTNFFVMFIDFGCKTAVTQFIASSKGKEQSDVANSIIVFRLITVAVISLLVLLGQNILRIFDSSESILIYTSYIPIMLLAASFDELVQSMLQGFESFNYIAISNIIRSTIRLILSFVFLAIFRLEVFGLIYSFIISFALSALFQYLLLPIPKKLVLNFHHLKKMLKFGFPLQLSRLLWFASGRMNIFLLGTLAGPASVAFFAVAERIPNAFQRLSESFTKVYFPRMTNLLSEGRKEKAQQLINQSLQIISFLMAFAALIGIIFSKTIITLLFTNKYFESHLAFALLMLALHMGFLVQIMGYTLTSAGFPGRSLVENIIRTVIIIIANFLLIPVLGFIGAACASIIANYLVNPLSVWLLKRSSIDVQTLPYVKQTGILLLCSFLFWWLEDFGIILQIALIALFIFLNKMFSTVTLSELTALIPESFIKKFAFSKST
jgi:O-antigen/teichoic acid export membrane protein